MAASLLHLHQSNDVGIEPLTASNYTTWSRDMETILRDSHLWHLIESPKRITNSNALKRQNKWAKELIAEHVDESFMGCFRRLTNQKNAQQMWEALAEHDFEEDNSNEYNQTGYEALQRARTTEEKSNAVDQMHDEYNADPDVYAETVTPVVLQNLTDMLQEPTNPSSLKEKILVLIKDFVEKHVTRENIKMCLQTGVKILLVFDHAVPQSPQSRLCIAILVALAMCIDDIFYWLDEMDVKNTLTIYFKMISNMSSSALRNAGYYGMAAFFEAQQIAIRVFKVLPHHMQETLIDISLKIIEKASDISNNIVTACLAWLNKMKDVFVAVSTELGRRVKDCLKALFRMMTNGVKYAKECIKHALDIMHSFGNETVGKYIDENRDSIDVDKLEKSYTYWETFRGYLGVLLNWFRDNVLWKLNKFVTAAANFVEENPLLTAGLVLGGLFLGAMTIGSSRSRNQ